MWERWRVKVLKSMIFVRHLQLLPPFPATKYRCDIWCVFDDIFHLTSLTSLIFVFFSNHVYSFTFCSMLLLCFLYSITLFAFYFFYFFLNVILTLLIQCLGICQWVCDGSAKLHQVFSSSGELSPLWETFSFFLKM